MLQGPQLLPVPSCSAPPNVWDLNILCFKWIMFKIRHFSDLFAKWSPPLKGWKTMHKKWQGIFSLLKVGGGRLYRVPPLRAFFHTLTGARYVMLFHNGGLKNNGVTFFPNRDTFHCSQLLPICRCCRRAEDDTDLPEAIVESAKIVIISKNNDLDEDQVLIE